MNKKILVAVIAIIVVALVMGGIYWFIQKNNAETPFYGTTNNLAVPPEAISTSTASNPSLASSTSRTQTTTSLPTPILNTMTSPTIGTYLTAKNGMTLYTYSKDTSGVSTCTGPCALFWPPYTITSGSQTLTAGSSINGTVSTIKSGGALQIIYNGMPLYFWSQDHKPGDITGNNVSGFIVAKP